MERRSTGSYLAILGVVAVSATGQPAAAAQDVSGTVRVPQAQYFATPRSDEGDGPAPIPAAGAVAIDSAVEARMREEVSVPDGFELTLFAGPPVAMYPVCVAEGADDAIYVCVDPNSSLSRIPGIGRVMRLVDEDNDGQADRYTTFAEMDSPRGIVSDGETVYVMHPPTLTAYRDTDGDGIADASQDLVTGLGRDLEFRGADHATNGITMGIDGWIYVAVGDYGFQKAVGTDGTAISNRGGAVVRVRPDGTNLEIYATGTRNTYDLAIDPFLHVFLRDNTDDGGGWDTRLHYLPASAFAGYPTHYRNFASEHFPYLHDYGSGSGVGAVWIQDPAWPEPFRNTLLTGDWTVHKILRHPLSPKGSIFDVEQHDFIELVRPTDVIVDARSHLYVSSLSGGQFRFEGDTVGYVFRVTPEGVSTEPPAVQSMTEAQLVDVLRTANAVHRLRAQQELLRRDESDPLLSDLERLVLDANAATESRVAAMFTLKQLVGARANPLLARAATAADARIRALALRALADRKDAIDGVDPALFVQALSDADDHVKVQAIIGLARLGAVDAASAILPLTASSDQGLAHIAVNAVVELGAPDAALRVVDTGTPELRAGALRALSQMHQTPIVRALLARLDDAGEDPAMRLDLLRTLARLYNREAPWAGDWWTTRPSNIGPYYSPAAWEASPWIRPALRQGLLEASRDVTAIADAFVLNRVLPQGARPLLAMLHTESDPAYAALVDAMVGTPSIRAAHVPLLEQLSERSLAHKAAVAELVSSQGVYTDAILPLLRQFALDEILSDEVRANALDGIGDLTDREGTAIAAAVFAQVNPEAGTEFDTPVDAAWRRWVGSRQRGQELDFFIELAASDEPREQTLAYAVLLQRLRGNNIRQEVRDAVEPVLDAARADPSRAPLLANAQNIMPVSSDGETVQTAGDMAAGERVFNDYCAACHQPSGRGDGEVYPPLAGSEWVAGPEARLIRMVLQGLTGPILVEGMEYNSAMAGLGTVLDDDEIAAVLTYIRGAWGNSAAPIEPEHVAEIRAATVERTTPWTAEELEEVPPSDP